MPKSKKRMFILIGIALLIVFGLIYFEIRRAASNTSSELEEAFSKEIALTGKTSCIPHKNATDPQTLECTLGIETSEKIHYALDVSDVSPKNLYSDLPTGTDIRVSGVLVPVEALSSDRWNKYAIRGVIRARTFESLR